MTKIELRIKVTCGQYEMLEKMARYKGYRNISEMLESLIDKTIITDVDESPELQEFYPEVTH